jgi:hypothetical protein
MSGVQEVGAGYCSPQSLLVNIETSTINGLIFFPNHRVCVLTINGRDDGGEGVREGCQGPDLEPALGTPPPYPQVNMTIKNGQGVFGGKLVSRLGQTLSPWSTISIWFKLFSHVFDDKEHLLMANIRLRARDPQIPEMHACDFEMW